MEMDIRWIQRFNNYRKALARLGEAIELSRERALSDLEQQGMIQAFEFTYDLAWKTLQDILRERQRPVTNGGPKAIFGQAMEDGYINDMEQWLALKEARGSTAHAYDEEMADQIAGFIVVRYYELFIQLETRLQVEKLNQENDR
jgi:nucleotidyltransferase substrate binding protein (TIGR01987 family)